ncbi:hypothetical protein FORC47_p278 (plasmid) [Bacillus cereus]|nr:hypothetical protein FORC47_p278 [Bacillus cereus]
MMGKLNFAKGLYYGSAISLSFWLVLFIAIKTLFR